MKTEMLEYCKVVLDKVSFSPVLFKKEWRKAKNLLMPEEFEELKKWCRQKHAAFYDEPLGQHATVHQQNYA
jgi:hypothetical protein